MACQTKQRWFFGGCAIIYALALLFFRGAIPSWGQWYFPGPFHRQQSEAILRGSLALSHQPSDLAFDLCWSEGGVQQIWGLGIPLWRMPFDLAAKCLGQQAFPDGLVLAAALTVAAWWVLAVFFSPALEKEDGRAVFSRNFFCALGGVFILLIFPPFLSLLSAGISVHAEVLVYVYLYGLVLVCGLVALTRQPGWGRYWLLCGLAGAGGLVRPTLLYYGIATLLTATAVVALAAARAATGELHSPVDKFFRRLSLGAGLFLLGGMILWGTNYVRFGDGFEFGQRLSLQTDWLKGVICYSSRFDYPYQNEPLRRAARELFGALFQVQRLDSPAFAGEHFVGGQSPTFRYREFLFTTSDLSGAVLVLAGWTAGILSLRGWRAAWREGKISPLPVLALWSLLASVALALFYLRFAFIVDRYTMDFAPAFAAAPLVLWLWLTENFQIPRLRWVNLALFTALASWLGWEFVEIRCWPGVKSMTWNEVARRQQAQEAQPKFKGLPPCYQIGDRLEAWAIPFNGAGWEGRSGRTGVCVTLFVNDPEFLELELAAAPGAHPGQADVEAIRAKVGLEFLKRASLERANGGWRLRFAGPTRPRYQHGLQPVFIATVPKDHLADGQTPWVLKQVRWQEKDKLQNPKSKIQINFKNQTARSFAAP